MPAAELTTGRMNVQLTVFDGNHCPACGGVIERAPTGRPATYCTATCRKRASRSDGAGHVTKPEVAAVATPTVSPGESLRTPASQANLAAIAAGIATPVDGYGPVRAYCEVRGDGFGVVFGRDGGRVNEPAGPIFGAPRHTIDLADLLNTRLVDLNLIPNKMAAAQGGVAAAKPEVHRDRATPAG